MLTLICGPSSVGKSTLYNSGQLSELLGAEPPGPLIFAFDLAKGAPIPDNALIHYNLTRPIEYVAASVPDPAMNDVWSFRADPAWEAIRSRPGPKRAVLLVTSVDELRERIHKRDIVEPSNPALGRYDPTYWEVVYTCANLPMIYEMFLRELRDAGIETICVAAKDGQFERIDEGEVHAFLRRSKVTRHSPQQIAEMISPSTFEYQRVPLPHRLATSGQDRGEAANIALPANLAGQSVLDVGSALGALCFEAERRGAARVVGLEPRESRFRASLVLKEILNSDADLRHETLDDFETDEGFDYVLLLNVIHHLKEPMRGLRRCAALARRTLAVEYPDFRDPIFATAFPHAPVEVLNALPVIGVSSQRVDQTFIFTATALERVLMDHDPAFERVEFLPSPNPNRTIALFHKAAPAS